MRKQLEELIKHYLHADVSTSRVMECLDKIEALYKPNTKPLEAYEEEIVQGLKDIQEGNTYTSEEAALLLDEATKLSQEMGEYDE